MEWYITAVGSGKERPRHINGIRCFRVMGMWGFLEPPLVSTPMGRQTADPFHRSEGAHPNSGCSSGFWPPVERKDSSVPSGQLGCGTSSQCYEVHLMHLIRVLVFLAAYFDFWFRAERIAGSSNTQADALSRNKMSSFFLEAPTASPEGRLIPAALVSLLAQALTWTSTTWIELFSTTIQQL